MKKQTTAQKGKANVVKKFKNRDLYMFRDGFDGIRGIEFPGLVTFKILKNLAMIKDEIKVLEEIQEMSEDYKKKYQPEVEKLAKKHCRKDENGNPSIRMTRRGEQLYDFDVKGKEEFDKEVEVLEKKEEFAELVEKRKSDLEKFNEALELDTDIEFLKIPYNLIKDQKIAPGLLEPIFPLLEE